MTALADFTQNLVDRARKGKLDPVIGRRIEELEAQLRAARASGTLLRDTVTPADVAAVAASWTGKPVEELAPG